MFRPDLQPVGDYLTRIARVAMATLLSEEFGQVGGDWHPTRMARHLRQSGAASVADPGQGASELAAALKTDLVWPTLTDDKSGTKDVVLFYEEFEDVCALANNCSDMSARERLLALRARCKGSRQKTYTNAYRAYRAAWKSGEVISDPEAVYSRIKNKHLMFGPGWWQAEGGKSGAPKPKPKHQAFAKGKLTGHQFEPLFEASIADLEAVGLGKTPRELYLSYLRKMPPHVQKEIRQDKRIWRATNKVVLEYEQREAKAKGAAKPPGTVCPFFQKNGSCRKGANCDMVHTLLTGQDQPECLADELGAPFQAGLRGAVCCLIGDTSQCRKTKLQWQALAVRLAAGNSVRDAYLADGRGAAVGSGLKGLHHSKAVLLAGETAADLIVGSLNWSTSSKANSECGVQLGLAPNAPITADFLREFQKVHEAAERLEDAKPPGVKPAAATGSAGPAGVFAAASLSPASITAFAAKVYSRLSATACSGGTCGSFLRGLWPVAQPRRITARVCQLALVCCVSMQLLEQPARGPSLVAAARRTRAQFAALDRARLPESFLSGQAFPA
ncbi:unnamed protein product [Symbiodinium microadriaticum]|nr:unnamed protein product [Symbiodinium microadriaticum]